VLPATRHIAASDTFFAQTRRYSVLPPLQTNEQEFILILPEPFSSCPSKATFASSLYTITKQLRFWPYKSQDSVTDIIFAAYQQQYNLLKLKGYKIRLNVMDNQARTV
jgi:hypothetical protein